MQLGKLLLPCCVPEVYGPSSAVLAATHDGGFSKRYTVDPFVDGFKGKPRIRTTIGFPCLDKALKRIVSGTTELRRDN